MEGSHDHGTREPAGAGLLNCVRSGPIGVVGSGTAAQEVSVRIHDFGGGVSTVVRTGELRFGGSPFAVALVDGLRTLDADAATQVIVLVGVIPPPGHEGDVRREIAACRKPVVTYFIGAFHSAVQVHPSAAKTTKEAALQAVVLSGIREEDIDLHSLNWPLIHDVRGKLTPEQQYVRGLFRAPELCAEAMYLSMEKYRDVYGSLHPDPSHRLGGAAPSIAHTYVVLRRWCNSCGTLREGGRRPRRQRHRTGLRPRRHRGAGPKSATSFRRLSRPSSARPLGRSTSKFWATSLARIPIRQCSAIKLQGASRPK